MPAKREARIFVEIIAHSTQATNPAWQGGESRIVKLVTRRGRHLGTVHEIVMPDGSIPHSHPKDYTLRDCSRIRVHSEPEALG